MGSFPLLVDSVGTSGSHFECVERSTHFLATGSSSVRPMAANTPPKAAWDELPQRRLDSPITFSPVSGLPRRPEDHLLGDDEEYPDNPEHDWLSADRSYAQSKVLCVAYQLPGHRRFPR